MMRLFLPFVFVFCSVLDATAQSLSLRSGEHGDFTRLTLGLPEKTEWRVQAGANRLRLTLAPRSEPIEVASVFRRIGRTRIANIVVEPDGAGLEVELGCDCGFRASVQNGSLLVIDIGESISKTTSVSSSDINDTNPSILTSRRPSQNRPFMRNNRSDLPVLLFQIPVLDSDVHADPELPEAPLDRGKKNRQVATVEAVGALPSKEQLRSEMGRALELGLLTATDPTVQVEVFPSPDSHLSLPIRNVRTRLATEADQFETAEAIAGDTGQDCPNSEALKLSDWGAPDGFGAGLSKWRLQLTQEFDQIDEKAALGLTRHYLHYGFGQEALDAIKLLPTSDPEAKLLASIARIIDFGHDPQAAPVSQMIHCSGAASLWALLSAQNSPRGLDIDTAALRLAFEDLPRHLRDHLGPLLADRLIRSGEEAVAEAIFATRSLLSEEIPPGMHLAEARLDLTQGELDHAKDVVGVIVETDSDLSPQAIVVLIDALVASDRSVDVDYVDLVASYEFELRQSSIAPDLARAHVLALAHSGQFVEALDRLAFMPESDPNPSVDDTRLQVLNRLLHHASDIAFLTTAIDTLDTGLPAYLGNGFANRLLNLGFPEIADDYLAAAAEGDWGRERRILRAKSALALSEPDTAEAELLGLSGEDADLLRDKARRLRGEASPIFAAVSALTGDERNSDFDLLPMDELRPGMPEQESSGVATINQPGLLGLARSMIEDSERARTEVQNTLNGLAVDEPG